MTERDVVVLRGTEVAVEGFSVEEPRPALSSYSKWQVRAVASVFTVPFKVAVVVVTDEAAWVVTTTACDAVTAESNSAGESNVAKVSPRIWRSARSSSALSATILAITSASL